MKIRIQIGSNDNTILVLPAECAGTVGALLASAEVLEREGYSSPAVYKACADGVRVDYVPDSAFAKPSEELLAARKDADRERSAWHAEYQKGQKLTQELRDANAALEALRSVQGCRAPAVAHEAAQD